MADWNCSCWRKEFNVLAGRGKAVRVRARVFDVHVLTV